MTVTTQTATEADIKRIADFLAATYRLNQNQHNWELRRWYGFVHYEEDDKFLSFLPQVRLWQDDGQIVGVVHPEYTGSAFFEIHPDYRHLEPEMLTWAEANLSKTLDDGKHQLDFWPYDYDTPRQALLRDNGYQEHEAHGFSRWVDMDYPFDEITIAEGYQIRGLNRTRVDAEKLVALTGISFGHEHNADMYMNYMKAPNYEPELDIVAVAPDGTFAATSGFTVDAQNLIAQSEPVCTHPDHRRKGLARACILTGLHMLKERGIKRCYVGAGDNPAANKLYEVIGFIDAHKTNLWRKQW